MTIESYSSDSVVENFPKVSGGVYNIFFLINVQLLCMYGIYSFFFRMHDDFAIFFCGFF